MYIFIVKQPKMRTLSLIMVLLATSPFFGLYAQAPGDLDPSFDLDGRVTTLVGSSHDIGNAVAVQSDGKIVVAGITLGSNFDFAVVRYNSDGSLDNTFSSDGIVTTEIGIGNDDARSVIIQSDGKIIVAGGANMDGANEFAVVRFNSDGSLDNTFDVDGKLTTAIGTIDDKGTSVVLQSDGKILVAGISQNGANYDFALIRYNSNGSLDNTFDSDGILTTDFASSDDQANSVIIQPDGKIIVTGISGFSFATYNYAIVRYNIDGSLDNTFSGDGKVTTDFSSNGDQALSAALQLDGKIVAAGFSYTGANIDFSLARYNNDGSLDNAFDTDGKQTTPIGTFNDYGYSVAVQTDGKIVLAGRSSVGANSEFALACYNSDGSIDNGFSGDGKLTTSFGSTSNDGLSLVLQQDGKIVVAGKAYNGSNDDFAVARYLTSFNVGDLNFSADNNSLLVYPSPLEQEVIISYILNKEENISIYLVDLKGQVLKSFLVDNPQMIGAYKQCFSIPDGLASGSYYIVIATEAGKTTIKVMK